MTSPSVIESVEQLLGAFLEKERAALDRQQIEHRPTIGAMYEGLTREVLSKAIPRSADLRVVSGFARGAEGKLTKQLDCMLVMGDGEEIPRTGTWIYDLPQVIAVIEVKKNLYGNDVDDGHANLASVVEADPSMCKPLPSLTRHAFQSLTHCSYPRDPSRLESVDPELAMLWHLLVLEAAAPVRILLGFHGYKTLASLGAGVIDHLNDNLGVMGRGPMSWPHLIANANGAIVKGNGMPWAAPLEDGWWHALVRLETAPVYPVLELVWSRLNYMGLLDAAVFGDDRSLDEVRPLVKARYAKAPQPSWKLEAVRPAAKRKKKDEAESPAPVRDRPETRPWQPVQLTEEEHTLILLLCADEVDVDQFAPDERTMQVRQLKRLRGLGLVGPDPTAPSIWRLLTDQLNACVMPDGRIVAAENSTGRLTRWVAEQQGKD